MSGASRQNGSCISIPIHNDLTHFHFSAVRNSQSITGEHTMSLKFTILTIQHDEFSVSIQNDIFTALIRNLIYGEIFNLTKAIR